jgi:hypothetical protein
MSLDPVKVGSGFPRKTPRTLAERMFAIITDWRSRRARVL